MPESATSSSLAGTRALIRLALRRDRIVLPIWIVVVVALIASTASAFQGLYPTVPERQQFASTIELNATIRALTGRVYDGASIGGLTAWRLAALAGAILALMSVFNVVRHTRAEEETGRLELLGSAVVGRRASLAAAVVVAGVANVIAGVASGALLTAMGEQAAGSFALGSAVAGSGLVFVGVSAVAAQLTESARTAVGIGSAAVIASYLLRAVGDSADGSTWVSWLSPIGWAQQVRAFGGDRWWVVAMMVVTLIVLVSAAVVLAGGRDLGAGLLATRSGPAVGGRGFDSVAALARRLQRGPLIAWAVGFAVMGLAFGSIGTGVEDLVKTSPQFEAIFQQLGGTAVIQDAFFTAIFGIFGMIAAAYGVSAALRLRAEESAGHAESLLCAGVSRVRWAWSHLLLAFGGTAVLMLLAGIFTGLAFGLSAGDLGQVWRQTGTALGQVPAVWVVIGIAMLIVGVVPSLSALAWGVLVVFVLIGQLGATLGLPQAVMDLSPFTHTTSAGGASWVALGILILLAVALTGSGMQLLRRRDIR